MGTAKIAPTTGAPHRRSTQEHLRPVAAASFPVSRCRRRRRDTDALPVAARDQSRRRGRTVGEPTKAPLRGERGLRSDGQGSGLLGRPRVGYPGEAPVQTNLPGKLAGKSSGGRESCSSPAAGPSNRHTPPQRARSGLRTGTVWVGCSAMPTAPLPDVVPDRRVRGTKHQVRASRAAESANPGPSRANVAS
jgi:hypothetical protein